MITIVAIVTLVTIVATVTILFPPAPHVDGPVPGPACFYG